NDFVVSLPNASFLSFFLSRFVQWVERMRRCLVNSGCQTKDYDEQRRRRHRDAPRREEERKGEKEGCADDGRLRERKRRRRALEARDEGCEWLDGDLRAGGAEE